MPYAYSTMTSGQSDALKNLTDPRESIAYDQSNFCNGFLETSYAEYCVTRRSVKRQNNQAEDICLIQVRPKGLNSFVTLCGKPNCLHSDNDCNAYVSAEALGYYKDRIYAVYVEPSENPWVVSMLPDGTDRRNEVEIPQQTRANGEVGFAYYFLFHCEKLIIISSPDMNDPIEEQICKVLIVDLETKQITEPFSEFFTPMISLGTTVQPVGSVIYVDACFWDRLDARWEYESASYWWISMDMDTGEVKKLHQASSGATSSYAIEKGMLYYVEAGEGFMAFNIDTGVTENLGLPVANMTSARIDGEYIYAFYNEPIPAEDVYQNLTMFILDRDLNVLNKISLGKFVAVRYTDEEYVLLSKGRSENAITLCLDKSKFGTDELKLEPFG